MPENTAHDPHPEWLFGLNPGAIEQQEREGQQQLVQDQQLPTELIGCIEDDLRTVGIALGETVDGDPLFRHVELPEGWDIRATEHPMWSEVIDEQERPWFRVFYKAAFYDRKAHIMPAMPA